MTPDIELATRDNATNRRAVAEYIASLDATGADADMARRDEESDRRAMADWLRDAETMQAEYRDYADTLASLR